MSELTLESDSTGGENKKNPFLSHCNGILCFLLKKFVLCVFMFCLSSVKEKLQNKTF
jgi:hypothetical protein